MRGYLAGRHPTSSPGFSRFQYGDAILENERTLGTRLGVGRHHCGFAEVVICAWAEIQPGSSVPCEQSENNEWFRMNEVSVQIFSGNSPFVFS